LSDATARSSKFRGICRGLIEAVWRRAASSAPFQNSAASAAASLKHGSDGRLERDDLGPDGGGRILAQGTPEGVSAMDASFTGQHLRNVLGKKVKRAA